MHKFVALYTVPPAPDEFDAAYFGTHLPLIARVPGIARTEVSRVTRVLHGRPRLHLMAEMTFEDAGAMRAALAGPEWAAAGRNLTEIGGMDLATLFLARAVDDATTE